MKSAQHGFAISANCFAILFLLANALSNHVVAQDTSVGLSCRDGFEVTQFSDDSQASDIFCFTFDSRGRIVVAGADYIRILEDTDNDSIADKTIDFAKAPTGGVQGMCVHGNNLYCSAGGGIIRFQDANHDDRADGPAQLLFNIKTGAEHDAHAIRKGPDGWWYLSAGNFAGVKTQDINSNSSPITNVREGVIMRFSPDFSKREVFAHGFRNAYDFDFDGLGNLYNFDSDGERDITLPWYRPTRVFHVTPGSDAGFVSRSWKMPNHFFEMPGTIAELGRGSPTGVAVYRHNQFPSEFRDAIFVLDWTFGTVKSIKTSHVDGTVSGTAEPFVDAKGAFGFAPTDVEVGPDGAIYISVGGRGTRGSIYRIQWIGELADADTDADLDSEKIATSKLAQCLNAHQPLSAWSRAKWEPIARKLGTQPFVDAVIDESLSEEQRCRAVEILADVFGGVEPADQNKLATVKEPVVLARTAWLIGRTCQLPRDAKVVSELLKNRFVMVRTHLLRGLCGKKQIEKEVGSALLLSLHSEHRSLRQAASRFLVPARILLTRNDADPRKIPRLYSSEWLSLISARGKVDTRSLEAGIGFFEAADTVAEQLDSVRMMQQGLGDAGPRQGVAPVFDGYVSSKNARPATGTPIEILRKLVGLFPSDDPGVDFELARLYSMTAVNSPSLVTRMLDKISDKSEPVSDIHYLICIANLSVQRSANDRIRIAEAMAGLQEKIERDDLNQDSNWEPRIEELWKKHKSVDPSLSPAVLQASNFGHPAHSLFLEGLGSNQINAAIPRFVAYQQKLDRPSWSPKMLRYLADSPSAEHVALVREQFSDPGCRDDVVVTLARRPNEIDRGIFISGLDSPEPSVIGASLNALQVMRPSLDAEEQIALAKAVQRLGGEKSDFEARERIVRMLQKNTGLQFGFQFGSGGHVPQTQVIDQWVAEIKRRYPDRADELKPEEGIGPAEVAKALTNVPWHAGNAERGARLFEERSCAKCHGKRSLLGPDLAGVTSRFSTNDLFLAILAPSATVSSRYRTKIYDTVDGKSYTGMVIYESVDGVLLRTANNETVRLEHDEIEDSDTLSRSLMPAKLLDGFTAQDYADLYRFMQQQ